jgi:putative chitinase
MAEFVVDTPRRQAAFLAQCGHESSAFSRLAESFNYSPVGLHATFPTLVSLERAAELGRQPDESMVPLDRQAAIGDLVYGGRMGNAQPGDGFKYHGRGVIQLTGRDNYTQCGQALGLNLVDHPEILEGIPAAIRAAGWFWQSRGCNGPADSLEFTKLTRLVNGGLNGLDDRVARWNVAKGALGA